MEVLFYTLHYKLNVEINFPSDAALHYFLNYFRRKFLYRFVRQVFNNLKTINSVLEKFLKKTIYLSFFIGKCHIISS